MSAILLSGLVIRNAFQSENVFKVVMPRLQISYFNVDELMEDNITLYSRIEKFQYRYMPGETKPRQRITKDLVDIRKFLGFGSYGYTEAFLTMK